MSTIKPQAELAEVSYPCRGGSRIEFLGGGTDDVGGVISGCGQLRLPDLFLRSQNFEG